MEISVNYLAVGLAVVANFIVGWLWYGPVFGKSWAREMKMDMTVTPDKGVMIRGMIFMLIGNFLMAFVMANDIFVWNHFPGIESSTGTMSTVFSSSFFTWLGFYVPTHLGATTWENKSWKLTIINLAYHYVTLFLTALFIVKVG